jgi:hypothetical protein
MITRIGRDDVVRVVRTGEVGIVKGWADHEQLDRNGTIIDVQISTEKIIQVNGLALDLVAFAKLKNSKLAMLATALVALAVTFAVTYKLALEDVSGWLIFGIGLSFYVSADRTLTAMFLRKRVRINLPRKQVPHPSAGRRSVNKI